MFSLLLMSLTDGASITETFPEMFFIFGLTSSLTPNEFLLHYLGMLSDLIENSNRSPLLLYSECCCLPLEEFKSSKSEVDLPIKR